MSRQPCLQARTSRGNRTEVSPRFNAVNAPNSAVICISGSFERSSSSIADSPELLLVRMLMGFNRSRRHNRYGPGSRVARWLPRGASAHGTTTRDEVDSKMPLPSFVARKTVSANRSDHLPPCMREPPKRCRTLRRIVRDSPAANKPAKVRMFD